ncbi:hypothetical protein [Vibrio phage MZH0603]|nr:hypothetical protein [Vibrio phage MZH0603]
MHKHYEMIMAKAENTELTVIVGHRDGHWWNSGVDKNVISFDAIFNYFLCRPKHAEACLHWLNGGTVKISHGEDSTPVKTRLNGNKPTWEPDHIFMCNTVTITSEVKKREKWIIYRTDGAIVGPFDEKPTNITGNGQIIKIEVV